MSIEKYSTKALIVDYFDHGEHDRVYKLFTREFGMIMAHTKSIRKLESKLRAHMMPRNISLVTLVQGKEFWRVVGAEEKRGESNIGQEITDLLSRFIHGEESHKTLYDRVEEFLEKSESYDKQKSRVLFYFILLTELGYVDVKVLGVKDMSEYRSLNIDDLYTYFLLSENIVKEHVRNVLKEMQL